MGKKEQGSLFKFMPSILSVLMLGIIGIVFLNWMSDLDSRDRLDSLAREYILRMETQGCLTDTDSQELIQELSDMGMEQISLEGTTTGKVGYGNQVILQIQGMIRQKQHRLSGFAGLNQTEVLTPVRLRKASTAKY